MTAPVIIFLKDLGSNTFLNARPFFFGGGRGAYLTHFIAMFSFTLYKRTHAHTNTHTP